MTIEGQMRHLRKKLMPKASWWTHQMFLAQVRVGWLMQNSWGVLLKVRRAYDDMKKRRLDDFMAGFTVISMKLKEMYQMITLGGDAELELVDSLDPFSEV